MRIRRTNRIRGSGRKENERKVENKSGKQQKPDLVGQIPGEQQRQSDPSVRQWRGLCATFSQYVLLFSKYE